MNISRFFIDRPIFATVLSIMLFLAGLISIWVLPVSEYPDVVPPSVVRKMPAPRAAATPPGESSIATACSGPRPKACNART